ncbi:MAG: ribosome biogenesis GTP-binding protein YihA/YsxC [Bacteroidota bacterium]|nr:ribosome biogenesis GTP-binding protein YihA/YsxC [Bacteroidota bacterium]
MIIHDAIFSSAHADYAQLPDSQDVEIVFWGRSNVGKSSIINYLCNRKELARTSSTPGKTQTFNFYRINDSLNFIDLPGYGYAKISKTKKTKWDNEIFKFLKNRKSIQILFLLVDISIETQPIDIKHINLIGEFEIPLYLLLTKADKSKLNERSKHISQLKHSLRETWETLPPMIETSAHERRGKEAILEVVGNLLKIAD